jgi:hypothetical protein
MRILLLHPNDSEAGPWRGERWDLVVDLGRAGPETYERWSGIFGCRAEALERLGLSDFKRVREALFSGHGRVMDSHGFDWWELISIEYHERVERILRLEKLAERIDAGDEVWVTRGGFDSRVMERLLGRAVRQLRPASRRFNRVWRIGGLAAKLRPGQLLQIVGDKYDANYRVRRFGGHREAGCGGPVVLLPTAYVNASRTGLEYAAALPERDFLLVTTRQSGWVEESPRNVKTARLAAYAPGKCQPDEYRYLLEHWRKLCAEFGEQRELFILRELGAFDWIPATLADRLAVRDAWLRVFEREPVTAVLCTDDSNSYTRLPLLMARERGLPAIACHHGALDGRHLIKRSHADVILAKGRMERDYLTQVCGVPKEQVEIGAPGQARIRKCGEAAKKDCLVFFSEPYEVVGGRPEEIYREVLPALGEIAEANQCKLVIKLHPQESVRERRRMVKAALSPQQWQRVTIVDGALTQELLSRTWFAVTVQSTVAVECTLRGIPAFVCTWLECTDWRYVEQFVKFGAGMGIGSASEIRGIPGMVERFEAKNADDLWEAIRAERMGELLSQPAAQRIAAAV